MQLTHSRALAAAIVALSTCAGAAHVAERELTPAPTIVAAVETTPRAADAAALAPADSLAALGAGQAARRAR